MLLYIIILPIIGSLVSGLFGRYIGYIMSRRISTLSIVMACILSYYVYYDIMVNNNIYQINIGKWIYIEYIEVDWGFVLDELQVSLLIPIVTISSLVHIYACSYMSHDPHQSRFFSILSMFTGFMIVLVTGNNYVVMFLGWEMIGVASYLLISFWHTRLSAVKSGLSALLMNKFGDTFITIGLFILLYTFGSLNYSTIYSLSAYINTDILNIIMILLLIGCAAKSAQLGLHNWLLNSMEGPTPVSALLHAACLVCAGVYLLLRSSYILEYTPIVLLYILWLGGLTTIIAGLIAIVSNDLKKIIALSTMSQLGLMFVAIGISNYNVSLFHLFNHAMFKALLFMSAGSIIHSVIYETQDIRSYGGFHKWLPVTYICLIIASLSLMATPGLTGFYSKDILIECVYGVYSISGYIIYWFSIVSATLTTIYSIRLVYYVFYNNPNANKYAYHTVHESDSIMLLPMIILAIASLIVGYIFKDLYIGLGSPALTNSLFTHPNNLQIIDTEFSIPVYIKLLPLFLTILSVILVLYIYEYHYQKLSNFIINNKFIRNIYIFVNSRFMLDQILNNIILRYTINLSMKFNLYIDKGLLHILGPTGISNTLNILSYKLISLSTNLVINNSSQYSTGIKHHTTYLLSTILIIFIFYNFNISIEYILLFILLLFISTNNIINVKGKHLKNINNKFYSIIFVLPQDSLFNIDLFSSLLFIYVLIPLLFISIIYYLYNNNIYKLNYINLLIHKLYFNINNIINMYYIVVILLSMILFIGSGIFKEIILLLDNTYNLYFLDGNIDNNIDGYIIKDKYLNINTSDINKDNSVNSDNKISNDDELDRESIVINKSDLKDLGDNISDSFNKIGDKLESFGNNIEAIATNKVEIASTFGLATAVVGTASKGSLTTKAGTGIATAIGGLAVIEGYKAYKANKSHDTEPLGHPGGDNSEYDSTPNSPSDYSDVNSMLDDISPLEQMLDTFVILDFILIYLVLILCIQLLVRYLILNNIEIKSNNIFARLLKYLIKINSKSNFGMIIVLLVVILFFLIASLIFAYLLSTEIDSFVNVYISKFR